MTAAKKIALFALLSAVALFVAPAPELAVPPQSPAVASAPVLAPLTPVALAQPPLPFCGDLCWNPGQERGCIDNSQGVWRRVICVCSNGSWTC